MDSKTLLERANYLKAMAEEARLNAERCKKEADAAVELAKTTTEKNSEEPETLEKTEPEPAAPEPVAPEPEPEPTEPVPVAPAPEPVAPAPEPEPEPPAPEPEPAAPEPVAPAPEPVAPANSEEDKRKMILEANLKRKNHIELLKKRQLQALNVQKFRRGMF